MRVNIQLSGFEGFVELNDKSYDLYQVTTNTFIDSKGVKSSKYGQRVEAPIGYFKSIGYAVDEAIRLSMASRDEQLTLKEFVAEYKAIKEELLNTI